MRVLLKSCVGDGPLIAEPPRHIAHTSSHTYQYVQLTGSVWLVDTVLLSNTGHRNPSIHLPSHTPVQPSMGLETTDREIDAAAMLSTLATPGLAPSKPQGEEADTVAFDNHDDRSSSLSELGDASDDQSEPTPRPAAALDPGDNDSEAETERLENTPRKLTRTATDTSLASELVYQRTPSKLAHSKTVDENETTKFDAPDVAKLGKSIDGNAALHALSLAASSEAASFTESAGKKRKRPSVESNTPEGQAEEPAKKRSGSAKDAIQHEHGDEVVVSLEQADAEDEIETAEERISQLAHEEIELEERQADIAAEAVNELATVAKHAKPRKVGKRGKRKLDDMSHVNEALTSIEGPEGDGDGDDEEDDSGAVDEEGTWNGCISLNAR